jgi:hypothetical protein
MSLDMKEIRKWAAAQGMTVGVRGPLSAEIISAYIAQGAIPSAPPMREEG